MSPASITTLSFVMLKNEASANVQRKVCAKSDSSPAAQNDKSESHYCWYKLY